MRADRAERIRFGELLGNGLSRSFVIHAMLGWAVKPEILPRNVDRFGRGNGPKAAPSPARALSAQQVDESLHAARSLPYHAFFAVAAATGMRRGDLVR